MLNIEPVKSGGYIISCNSPEEWHDLLTDLIERGWWPENSNALGAYSHGCDSIRLAFDNYALKSYSRDSRVYYRASALYRQLPYKYVDFTDLLEEDYRMDDVLSAISDLL